MKMKSDEFRRKVWEMYVALVSSGAADTMTADGMLNTATTLAETYRRWSDKHKNLETT